MERRNRHYVPGVLPLEGEKGRMEYAVILHRAEKGGYWVEVPALPGCFSQGETVEEALQNVCGAIESHLLALKRGPRDPRGMGGIAWKGEGFDRRRCLSWALIGGSWPVWVGIWFNSRHTRCPLMPLVLRSLGSSLGLALGIWLARQAS